MKNSDILKILYENKGQYVSGEYMANIFGVSRTALSKRIQKLKENGIKIDAVTNRGYKLLEIPEEISQDNVYIGISDEQIIGKTVKVLEEVSSTNDYAKRVAKSSQEGTVILSKVQTEGKGRRGRSFESKEGGLYFTIILKPDIKIEKIPFLTQVAACAVYKGLYDLGVNTKIKWPNDIILNGKKLCGILCEMTMEIDMLDFCVVGIGINVDTKFDRDLKQIATSIKNENLTIQKKQLFWEILRYFDNYYKEYLKGDYGQILDILRTNSNIIGEKINIISAEKTTKATAMGIDERGYLMVQYEDGQRDELNYGEISIRKRQDGLQ